MTTAMLIVTLALLITKGLDCWTTLRGVTARTETNLVASRLMRRFGVRATVWIVFALACTVIATGASLAHVHGGPGVQLGYILVGCLISLIQFAVAHTNYTGRWNFITTRVLVYHCAVGRLIQGGGGR
ncbi:MAG: hypothetical protein VB934_18730 [Polyangiaceae bacterium]